ncbi:hypothetical protein, partial [Actinacidiphila rubida]
RVEPTPARTAELLSELHPWDVPAAKAVQDWAKVVAVPSRKLPDITSPTATDVPVVRPDSKAGSAYHGATSHARLRAAISSLLGHAHTVDVAGRPVTVGLDLTAATRLHDDHDELFKARRYQQGDDDQEARSDRVRGWYAGGGPESGGGAGDDAVLARTPYETGREIEDEADGGVSATVEHNREATRPFRYYRFDATITLRAADGREMRIDVPDGLYAILPVTNGALHPDLTTHFPHLFTDPADTTDVEHPVEPRDETATTHTDADHFEEIHDDAQASEPEVEPQQDRRPAEELVSRHIADPSEAEAAHRDEEAPAERQVQHHDSELLPQPPVEQREAKADVKPVAEHPVEESVAPHTPEQHVVEEPVTRLRPAVEATEPRVAAPAELNTETDTGAHTRTGTRLDTEASLTARKPAGPIDLAELPTLPDSVLREAADILQQHVDVPFVIGDDAVSRAARAPYEQAADRVARALYGHGEEAAHAAAARALHEIPGARAAGHKRGIIAAGKKKRGTGQNTQQAPQQATATPGAGPSRTARTTAEPARRSTGPQPSGTAPGPQRHIEATTSSLPPAATLAVREAVAVQLAQRPPAHRNAVVSATVRLMQQAPAPAGLPLDGIIGSVDFALASGDELATHVLAHPYVVYAAAQQPQLYLMLEDAPALAPALDRHPAVLWQLTRATAAWHKAQGEATSQVLLRPDVLDGLEGDPELQEAVFNRSTLLLRNMNGDLGLIRHVMDITMDIITLADQVPEFAEAVISLGSTAVESLWQMGAESTLTAALLSRVYLGGSYTVDFHRLLFTDVGVRSVLRALPEQNQVALLTAETLNAVAANPGPLRALQSSPALTDVLETAPEIAERLLADPAAMDAAVANPAVYVALSYDAQRYTAVAPGELAQALAAETGPEQARQDRTPDLSGDDAARLPVLVLLRRLTDALPAVRTAVSGLHADQARQVLNNERMLRLLARNPMAVRQPHQLRQLLTLPVNLALPEDDGAALTIALAAARHEHVLDLYLTVGGRASHQPSVNILAATRQNFRNALLRFPAIGSIAHTDVRTLYSGVPLEALAFDPWLASALYRAPGLRTHLGGPDTPVRQALQVAGGALTMLMFRQYTLARELTRAQWEQVARNVTAEPRLLPRMFGVFGQLTTAHWSRLLTDDRMFPLLASRIDTPTVRGLLRLPGV